MVGEGEEVVVVLETMAATLSLSLKISVSLRFSSCFSLRPVAVCVCLRVFPSLSVSRCALRAVLVPCRACVLCCLVLCSAATHVLLFVSEHHDVSLPSGSVVVVFIGTFSTLCARRLFALFLIVRTFIVMCHFNGDFPACEGHPESQCLSGPAVELVRVVPLC